MDFGKSWRSKIGVTFIRRQDLGRFVKEWRKRVAASLHFGASSRTLNHRYQKNKRSDLIDPKESGRSARRGTFRCNAIVRRHVE
jgi:hypothetical protein